MSDIRQACCDYHQFGRSNQIKSNDQEANRSRSYATHDDAVVALRRLDVELVLQQEPGGSNRVAEAAEHLRRERDRSATELHAELAKHTIPGVSIRLTRQNGTETAIPRLQGILPGTGSHRTCRCTACTQRSTRTWKLKCTGTQARMERVNIALRRRRDTQPRCRLCKLATRCGRARGKKIRTRWKLQHLDMSL